MNEIDVDLQEDCELPTKWFRRILELILNSLDIDNCHLGFILCGRAYSRDLNYKYREQDKATNVLSFPIRTSETDQDPELGDIVLCYDIALDESREYGETLKQRIVYLLVHACLHLSGTHHDTPQQEKAMYKKMDKCYNEVVKKI